MLLKLLDLLSNDWGYKIPAVFEYYSTRMILAFITALLFTILFGKPFIKKLYQLKVGENVKRDHCSILEELHRSKNNTPTMGGLLIVFSLLVSLLLWMDLSSSFTLILLVTTLVTAGVGAYDDYLKLRYKNKKGLSGKKKLLIQLVLSGLIGFYLTAPLFNETLHQGKKITPPGAKELSLSAKEYATRLYIPFCKHPICHLPMIVAVLLIMFVITGASNAVNLTDGLDGLAAGTLLFASMAFAAIAFISNHVDLASYLNILYIEGSGEIAIYLAAFSGACLGFLWYNAHPAQIFMGDTGSLPLGAILGVSAVLLRRELLLSIIGGVFVLEALSVMIQVGSYRLRNRKRVFLCAPLHHHFEYKGLPETKVVARFWILGMLLAALGLITLKFQ